MGYNPGAKSGPGEVVDFQGLPPPISRMDHLNDWVWGESKVAEDTHG